MIDRKHKLPLARQAKALAISRGSVYVKPRPVPDADLSLMRRIDPLHLEYPFVGSRMLRDLLLGEGHKTGRLHVRTLMNRMGVEAIYRRPNTSKPKPGHKIHPYETRLCLSDGHRRLVFEKGSGVAFVDHAGGGFLHRGAQEGTLSIWQT